jgi:imidazolonepropionase
MTGLDLVVTGAGELVRGPEQAADTGVEPGDQDLEPPAAYGVLDRFGPEAGLDVVEDGAIAVVDGVVAAAGPSEAITREYPPENATRTIDAGGSAVVPGFVDPHTHAVFAGDRSDEFAARLRGRDYQDILAEGGGILRTVCAVHEASDEALLDALLDRLDAMLAAGTTTAEIKSGYGLDRETELRMLSVIERADDSHPVDIVPTFMGAHAVPEGTTAESYTETVIEEQVPAVAEQGVATFCDVFCEEDVFSVEQARRILEAGRDHGLTPKLHAEEFTRLGGSQLAAELGATSADHLLHATDEDLSALGEAGVVPTYLPAAAFSLGESYADATPARERGLPVALGTDFNPNCHSTSMPMTIALASLGMSLTPEAALVGATRAAALALDLHDGRGTLRADAPGDLVVLDAPSHVHLPYRFGELPIDRVYKGGELVATPETGVSR